MQEVGPVLFLALVTPVLMEVEQERLRNLYMFFDNTGK